MKYARNAMSSSEKAGFFRRLVAGFVERAGRFGLALIASVAAGAMTATFSAVDFVFAARLAGAAGFVELVFFPINLAEDRRALGKPRRLTSRV